MICTKYCHHEHNLARSCTTLKLGTPQLYRGSPPDSPARDDSLVVDVNESKFLIPGATEVPGVEICTPSGGRIEISVGGDGHFSYSTITQERLPNFFMYCVTTEQQPNMDTAKSLDSTYDDWFRIKDIDTFVDLIQGDVHTQMISALGLPRHTGYGILELRGPVHVYGDSDESDAANTATITLLSDNGYCKFGGSQVLNTLTKEGSRMGQIRNDGVRSYRQGNPIWDAFWKHPRYKGLREYRVAYFPCFLGQQVSLTDLHGIAFLHGDCVDHLIVPLSCWRELDFRSGLWARN